MLKLQLAKDSLGHIRMSHSIEHQLIFEVFSPPPHSGGRSPLPGVRELPGRGGLRPRRHLLGLPAGQDGAGSAHRSLSHDVRGGGHGHHPGKCDMWA